MNEDTQADTEAAILAESDLLTTLLKDFYYNVSNDIANVRKLVDTLEANGVL